MAGDRGDGYRKPTGLEGAGKIAPSNIAGSNPPRTYVSRYRVVSAPDSDNGRGTYKTLVIIPDANTLWIHSPSQFVEDAETLAHVVAARKKAIPVVFWWALKEVADDARGAVAGEIRTGNGDMALIDQLILSGDVSLANYSRLYLAKYPQDNTPAWLGFVKAAATFGAIVSGVGFLAGASGAMAAGASAVGGLSGGVAGSAAMWTASGGIAGATAAGAATAAQTFSAAAVASSAAQGAVPDAAIKAVESAGIGSVQQAAVSAAVSQPAVVASAAEAVVAAPTIEWAAVGAKAVTGAKAVGTVLSTTIAVKQASSMFDKPPAETLYHGAPPVQPEKTVNISVLALAVAGAYFLI